MAEVVTKRSGPKAGQRVLVAHEDAGTCMLVRQALEEEFNVSVVMSPFDCLEWISEYRFAAAVCDLAGEKMGGRAMLELVSRVVPDLASRLVFLAPREPGPELAEFLRSSGNPWVPRPVLASELLEIVRAVAGQSTSIRP